MTTDKPTPRSIEDAANELDQLFKQRHTMKDVEAILHTLVAGVERELAEAQARAADRDRYAQGMANWKATAEAKDKQLAEREAEVARLKGLLHSLHALVWGECPSLLNEDSGGSGHLDADIRAEFKEES